jgi:glutamyl-tRNA synthetase
MLGFLFTDAASLVIEDDARASLPANTGEVLAASLGALELIPEAEWDHEAIEAALRDALIEGLGLKPRVAFGPLRVAISGRRVSPPLFESMQILGKAETIARLDKLSALLG